MGSVMHTTQDSLMEAHNQSFAEPHQQDSLLDAQKDDLKRAIPQQPEAMKIEKSFNEEFISPKLVKELQMRESDDQVRQD